MKKEETNLTISTEMYRDISQLKLLFPATAFDPKKSPPGEIQQVWLKVQL